MNMDPSVSQVLSGFQKANITPIEWETQLLRRLGYPLPTPSDLVFLIPDDEIRQAREITTTSGLMAAVSTDLPKSYLSELASQGFSFLFGDGRNKLILVPLSWTGVERDEAEIIPPSKDSHPCTIFTLPLPVFCAAYIRVISQEMRGSRARTRAIADLSNVIAYAMFDMSYDGNYMSIPEDDSHDEGVEVWAENQDGTSTAEKDALEMENALQTIRQWRFNEKDESIRELLLQLVSGTLQYENLPSR